MNVLLTSNTVKQSSGFPYAPLPLIDLVEMASFFKHSKIGYDVLDGQKLSVEDWERELCTKESKILIVVLDEAYIQNINGLKAKLSDNTNLVVVTENEDLIDLLIFEYGVDYVYFDKNKGGMRDLCSALMNPFSVFYDHILGVAFKNGLGKLTKTDKLDINSDFPLVITKSLTNGYDTVYVPETCELEEESLKRINSLEANILTDFTKYDSKAQYDGFYLKLPASKKAKKMIVKLVEEQNNIDKLHVYSSCDVIEDNKFYTMMYQLLDLSIKVKKAGFFKRILLSFKLNKIL